METLRATCNFPDPELLSALVDLYFVEVNAFVPLLHRPTFESSIASQLHLRDVQFGRIALLVCGIGARYSDDPRITSWSYDEPSSPGWIMFHQAQKMGRSVLSKPSLYDIQGYCVSTVDHLTYWIFTLASTSFRRYSWKELLRIILAGSSLVLEFALLKKRALIANEN